MVRAFGLDEHNVKAQENTDGITVNGNWYIFYIDLYLKCKNLLVGPEMGYVFRV